MVIAGLAGCFCWMAKGAQAGMPFEAQGEPVPLRGLTQRVMRSSERSAAGVWHAFGRRLRRGSRQ